MNSYIECYSYNGGNLKLIGIVDDFTSFTFERSYSNIGEWQIVISNYSNNAACLKKADFIKAGKGMSGLITKISQVKNDTDDTLTVVGVELKGLTEKRIVMPKTGESHLTCKGTPEDVVKYILQWELTSPQDSKRQIAGQIVFDNNTATTETLTYEGRFSSVSEDIITICETYEIGWYADIENGEITWHIYRGVDRKTTQSKNSRLIISYDYDSMSGSTLEQTIYNTNTALIAGQGEGVDRATTIINDDNAGLNRTEVYIDARDIEDDSLLPQRGVEKLAEYGSDYTFEITPSNSYFINNYRNGYDLGDVGTLKEEGVDFRLTSITEINENNQFSLSFVFGYDTATLEGVFKRMRGNTDALISKEA